MTDQVLEAQVSTHAPFNSLSTRAAAVYKSPCADYWTTHQSTFCLHYSSDFPFCEYCAYREYCAALSSIFPSILLTHYFSYMTTFIMLFFSPNYGYPVRFLGLPCPCSAAVLQQTRPLHFPHLCCAVHVLGVWLYFQCTCGKNRK